MASDASCWKSDSIFREYRFTAVLGQGGNAQVWSAVNVNTGEMVAVKTAKNKIMRETLVKEFIAMKTFDSPHIANPRCFFYGRNDASFMVLDKYAADLFFVINNSYICDDALHTITHDIGTALKTMHDKNIIHGDVKPENIFVTRNGTLVLGDFGYAQNDDLFSLKDCGGTLSYLGPETVMDGMKDDPFASGKPLDVFAFGITLFAAATRRGLLPPISSPDMLREFYETSDISARIDAMDRCDTFKDLLHGMLCFDPYERMTIDEVMTHPFLTSAM